MAKTADKNKAIALRKTGKSYSQIRTLINVSKSTLSNWLKDYPLSLERIRELRDWNDRRIEKYRATVIRKKTARLEVVQEEQKSIVLPLSKRDLYIAGMFLYWGEGSKTIANGLAITNTDPAAIKFFVKWLEKLFNVPRHKLKIFLQLYKDMDPRKELNFWSNALNLPKNQFVKPYIKDSRIADLTRKGGFGHGTCSVRINNARLAEKVLISLKVIRDYIAGQ